VSARLVYNKILTSTTVITEYISWLINVTEVSCLENYNSCTPCDSHVVFYKRDTCDKLTFFSLLTRLAWWER